VAAREKAMGAVRSKARTEGLPEKLTHLFDHPVWERIHETCIGCGTCTYLCPTCHCFDISDEKFGSDQARVRLWDSCMYTLFTLHASGHNPRPTGKERMRQRVMHKFNYTVKNWGDIFCVGCGRCVRDCPVNLDIREVVNELAGVPVEKT
jgi:ferredoxin